MKKISLEQFILDETVRNLYIVECGLVSYYRKQKTLINDVLYYTLTRANTKNPKKSNNLEIKEKYKRTGNYKALDDLTFELAKKYNFECIVVELIVNDFLPDVLLRYGYKPIAIRKEFEGLVAPSFYKLI
jgi:hypothetical protein